MQDSAMQTTEDQIEAARVQAEALRAEAANLEAAAAEAEAARAHLAASPLEAAAHLPVVSDFLYLAAIFALACFVGYYVVWQVTPALHTPLMSVTNAVSSVVIVGALIALGAEVADTAAGGWSRALGFVAVALASVNIFGGFMVTQRMLAMYKKKERPAAPAGASS